MKNVNRFMSRKKKSGTLPTQKLKALPSWATPEALEKRYERKATRQAKQMEAHLMLDGLGFTPANNP